MRSDLRWGKGRVAFATPAEAMAAIEQDGFNWRLLRDYFRFTDNWLSEGEYDRLLSVALSSIGVEADQNSLVDMLDLQYAVFLEQVAIQERILGKDACREESVAFGERVMAYLQINSNHRPSSTRWQKSARTAMFDTPPGKLINRLLGSQDT